MVARPLYAILTDQIVAGKMSVEEARDIVLRHKYYQHKPIGDKQHRQHDAAVAALEHNHGHHGDAARELDISRATLYRRLACAA